MSQVQQANHDKKQPTSSSKPTATAPKPASSSGPTTPPGDATAEAGKRKVTRKVYVCFGQVIKFDSVLDAEKYLNGEGAPQEVTIIKGAAVEKKLKVSLR
jgi:hypothetical protein